jgi:hypothetical protein
MPTIGQIIRIYHRVVNNVPASVPDLTLVDFEIELYLNGSPASESVTVSYLGDGNYMFQFSPTAAGTYGMVMTELVSVANPNSVQNGFTQSWIVTSSGVPEFSATFDNAFCGQSDVERYAGRKFTTTTTLSQNELAGMAEETAAYLIAQTSQAGHTITPDSMGAPPDLSTVAGQVLEDMLRAANALGVAARADRAGYLGANPNSSNRAEIFYGQFIGLAGGYDPATAKEIEGAIPRYIQSVYNRSFVTTHIDSGDTAAAIRPAVTPTEPGLRMTMDREY